jgi:hypothetical protein
MAQTEETAFPRLTSIEVALVKPLAKPCDYADGDVIFRAGQPDIDLYVVESGRVQICNPADGDRVIAVHEPGQFSGDIDILTGRPVILPLPRWMRAAHHEVRPRRSRSRLGRSVRRRMDARAIHALRPAPTAATRRNELRLPRARSTGFSHSPEIKTTPTQRPVDGEGQNPTTSQGPGVRKSTGSQANPV